MTRCSFVFTHACSYRNASISDKSCQKQTNKQTIRKKGEHIPRSVFNVKYIRIQRTLTNIMQAGNVDLNFLSLKWTPSGKHLDPPLPK